MSRFSVVVMGASWGGLRALERILETLPEDFSLPIVIAQHRDADADDELLASLLRTHTALLVEDVGDRSELVPGTVLIAPPGYHVLLDRGSVELSVDEPVQFARPSIDVLFESTAGAYGREAVGVLLTGANADGAAGLAELARRGGHTIVQDPATCERPEMPRAALAAMTPDAVLPLGAIGPELGRLCR
jgi:two-component system chemotaxis response regulator CheB